MITKMEESGRPLTVEDIGSLESQIGVLLPTDYKTFLLRYNGGRPSPSAFPIRGFTNNPFGVIQVFFGIDDEIDSCNLDWNFEILNGRLPTNLFAIACDGSGDLVCLSLFGEDAGSVVFWDFYAETRPPSYGNVYHVADSFSEFIDRLFPNPYAPAS